MILVVDIGNSNVVIGLYKDQEWLKTWRIDTISDKSVHYYQMFLSSCFVEGDINANDLSAIIMSSVVPDLTEKFSEFLKQINEDHFLILNQSIFSQLPVHSNNPFEIGTDLMANALAAHNLIKGDKIIVDFGTALTFTFVRSDGEIEGVNIVPGIKTAIKALSSNAAQLHEVALVKPLNILGKDTIQAIQNGVLIGYTGLVKHMIAEIKKVKGNTCTTVATGGLVEILPDLAFDHIDKFLTLNGLKWIAEKLLLNRK